MHSSPGLREQRLPGHSFEHKKEEQSQEPSKERVGSGKKKEKRRGKQKKLKRKRKQCRIYNKQTKCRPPMSCRRKDQFRFLHATCLANLKGSVGLILAKPSAMRISIPLDLSSRPFIPLPRFYTVSFVRNVLFHFYLLPSFSFLHVLPKRHMVGVIFGVLSTIILNIIV